MRLEELKHACRIYSDIGAAYDESYRKFRLATGSRPDLARSEHRQAFLRWLNKWGCRQFAIRYHHLASRNLADWYTRHRGHLPPPDATILSLSESELSAAAMLESTLADLQASVRHRAGKQSRVRFGDTGAPKILFAIREHVFPPCDSSIQKALGLAGRRGWLAEYLLLVRDHVREVLVEASSRGIGPDTLPTWLGRPHSSLPKLVDEYHWITITKGIGVPKRGALDI